MEPKKLLRVKSEAIEVGDREQMYPIIHNFLRKTVKFGNFPLKMVYNRVHLCPI